MCNRRFARFVSADPVEEGGVDIRTEYYTCAQLKTLYPTWISEFRDENCCGAVEARGGEGWIGRFKDTKTNWTRR